MSPSSRPLLALKNIDFICAPQTTNFNRLRKRLRRQAGDTISRFSMVADRNSPLPTWLVCPSGGKARWINIIERQRLAGEMRAWEQKRPGTKVSILRALSHIRPSHLLDARQFDFQNIAPQGDDFNLP